MTLQASKTALLIAAMATAITMVSLTPASAKSHWVSADAEVAEVVPANFKFKVKKHHGFKKYHHGGFKKKKAIKSTAKKKLILKKLF